MSTQGIYVRLWYTEPCRAHTVEVYIVLNAVNISAVYFQIVVSFIFLTTIFVGSENGYNSNCSEVYTEYHCQTIYGYYDIANTSRPFTRRIVPYINSARSYFLFDFSGIEVSYHEYVRLWYSIHDFIYYCIAIFHVLITYLVAYFGSNFFYYTKNSVHCLSALICLNVMAHVGNFVRQTYIFIFVI